MTNIVNFMIIVGKGAWFLAFIGGAKIIVAIVAFIVCKASSRSQRQYRYQMHTQNKQMIQNCEFVETDFFFFT
jgi:hypothetical protein